MTEQYNDLHQSFGRCLKDRDFISNFYERLLGADAAIPLKFEKTDFTQQRTLLRRGISMAISYAEGAEVGARAVDRMAAIHSRKGHAPVEPRLHEHWVDCLVQTINATDPKAGEKLEKRWRTAMKKTIQRFSEVY